MPLPVPIPQVVKNDGAAIQVAWRPLTVDGVATLLDKSGAAVASRTGRNEVSVPAPAHWDNAPYTVTVAATDGTSTGTPSPAVPVLVRGSTTAEVAYDGSIVELQLEPPGGTDYQHQPTLIVNGSRRNPAPFRGLSGNAPLPQPTAASDCAVQVTDFLEVPVDPSYSCLTSAPPGTEAGLITQPAIVTGARCLRTGAFEVDAQGPTSVGPPVSTHRTYFGDDSGQAAEVDLPARGGAIEVPLEGEPTWVQAAGTAISGGATVRGPYSPKFRLIGEAPAAISLALAAEDPQPLRASWAAIAPLPPPLTVSYEATLSLDGVPMEKVTSDTLQARFQTALPAGAVPSVSVLAVSSANSRGPSSPAARGPLKAAGTVVAYDPLGRLQSVAVPGWGSWAYTYDDLGNIRTARATKARSG